ncbi:FAD-dependent oxidoreductase [Falsiroseomonas selenitidurans]|uniref:FAD-dependent monooxygenase n=1 Tax=Falsiroseomonas selenitidurans TaxID=2716335 RepID=A0ABX1E1E2_9PROT|nr:FAD-dependent monooxygenase [Falsiroseomonas selenitidurans]NKC29347.1 FAD-dependent monooxygenase [Falsiroseomonas selenitidurans]
MNDKDRRIAIVGAGPVGLVLALRLATLGLPSLVLEAEADISEALRASTFHPPSLDMLDTLGLAAPLIEQGLVTPSWQIRRHEDGARAVFDLGVLKDDTAHPYRLQAEQWKLSRLILAKLAAEHAGTVELRFGAQVDTVVHGADHVALSGTGFDPVEVPYAVGCDGARSVIRRAMGLDFPGDTYPETTILATTPFPFHEVFEGLSNVNYVWTEHPAFAGTFSLLRVPGKWRASLYPAPGESIEQALEPAAIERKLQAIHPKATPYEVPDLRPYRIHQRIVDSYRVGRLLLAGDAAHLNSPSGGMGMNGGIHDAMELAATLAPVWRGEAEGDLLDRYTRRRQPVAKREIIAQADRNRARMRERDPARRAVLLADLQATAGDPVKAREHLLRSSMISGLRGAAAVD